MHVFEVVPGVIAILLGAWNGTEVVEVVDGPLLPMEEALTFATYRHTLEEATIQRWVARRDTHHTNAKDHR